jgi:hypothetical protein
MSVKTCPACGEAYISTATACADCGVPLVGDGEEAPAVLAEDDAVAYDLEDWDASQRSALTKALDAEGIVHRWGAPGELLVAEDQADAAEDLIDEVDNPDALPAEADDDDTAADVLSALYVASDVLQSDPRHSAAVVELLEAAERAGALGVPYGLDGATWSHVCGLADTLADTLGTAADDDEVAAAAHALREAVRPLV